MIDTLVVPWHWITPAVPSDILALLQLAE